MNRDKAEWLDKELAADAFTEECPVCFDVLVIREVCVPWGNKKRSGLPIDEGGDMVWFVWCSKCDTKEEAT